MNIKELHAAHDEVSAKVFFKGDNAAVTAIQLLKDALLKEHITKIKALLICVSGGVVFENEQGLKKQLNEGDSLEIEPMVKHWLQGLKDSQLLLIK